MDNDSYFWFADDKKMKYKHYHNHQKKMGKLKTDSPIYCIREYLKNIIFFPYYSHVQFYQFQILCINTL